jgi:WD40-like Beta Propeller Repeat
MDANTRGWDSVTVLIVSGCDGGATAAATPSASSTASSHGAPTLTRGLPAHGRIVFSLQVGNPVTYCNIVTIEPDAADLRMLTNVVAGSACDADPVWIPTGDRILFDSVTNTSDHLFSISAAGGSIRQLTSGLLFDSDPAISPDGTRIAFDRGAARTPPLRGSFS